ncbi:hypothetical protein BE08_06465 [Sorangium cellulosum]|uniref:PemK-like protein n=1 Tax=Sorangium cellulosum TaxID=56 RepID=A0A150PA48_SORCE|nr:hypothetical protein BE08_06465 [Sorangium cellulosum]
MKTDAGAGEPTDTRSARIDRGDVFWIGPDDSKARLGERIGSLSDARVDQILAGLRFQQASFFRR